MKLTPTTATWRELLALVGAKPIEWSSAPSLATLEPEWRVRLSTTGVDVSIDEIEIDADAKVYTYNGQQVSIYIKDTRRPSDVLKVKETAVRFHLTDCRTIVKMKEANRWQRYVAIARRDGLFPVFAHELDGTVHEIEVELGVCKNCIGSLDWKNYRQVTGTQRERLWRQFTLQEFFEHYASRLSIVPRESCSALPDSLYTADWQAVSLRAREKAGWRCASCRVDLRSARQCLHVHHRDKDKSNNRGVNLQVLCAVCHAQQPGHHSMYVAPAVRERILALRTDQGVRL
ncbi:MAG: hypothetical protein IPJ78_19275 [Gemmatimonadetes bacterium]|nr:hypothetical protein [Gemmatimonadota bacterium]